MFRGKLVVGPVQETNKKQIKERRREGQRDKENAMESDIQREAEKENLRDFRKTEL